MGCLISAFTRFRLNRHIKKSLSNEHMTAAQKIVEKRLQERGKEHENLTNQVRLLRRAMDGARFKMHRVGAQSKCKGIMYEEAKHEMEACLTSLINAEKQEKRLRKQVTDLTRQYEWVTNAHQDARMLKENLEFQKHLELSGMEPDIVMGMAQKLVEYETRLAATNDVMKDRQQALSDMTGDVNEDTEYSARLKEMMAPLSAEEEISGGFSTVLMDAVEVDMGSSSGTSITITLPSEMT
jgi:hypothetical protein